MRIFTSFDVEQTQTNPVFRQSLLDFVLLIEPSSAFQRRLRNRLSSPHLEVAFQVFLFLLSFFVLHDSAVTTIYNDSKSDDALQLLTVCIQMALLTLVLGYLSAHMNAGILKLVRNGFYFWMSIVEIVGICISYAAIMCWTPRAFVAAFNKFLILTWQVGYDALPVSKRKKFRWLILWQVLLVFVLLIMLQLRIVVPPCSELRMDFQGQFFVPESCVASRINGLPSFSLRQLTVNCCGTYIFLSLRLIRFAFQDPSCCVFIWASVSASTSKNSVTVVGRGTQTFTLICQQQAGTTMEKRDQPEKVYTAAESNSPARSSSITVSQTPCLQSSGPPLLQPMTPVVILTELEAKRKIVHLLIGTVWATEYLAWRERRKKIVYWMTAGNSLCFYLAGVLFLMLDEQWRRPLSCLIVVHSLVLVEVMVSESNLFLAKKVLTSFEFWLTSVKVLTLIAAVCSAFCWRHLVLMLFVLTTNANLLIDAYISPVQGLLRRLLPFGIGLALMAMGLLYFPYGSNVDCAKNRLLLSGQTIPELEACELSKSIASPKENFWLFLGSRSLSWAELGVTSGWTKIALYAKHIHNAIRFPKRLLLIKSRLRRTDGD